MRDLGRSVGSYHFHSHFMTTMLAAVLSHNPFLLYSSGFQPSVAAVFGILLLRKHLKALIESILLIRHLKK